MSGTIHNSYAAGAGVDKPLYQELLKAIAGSQRRLWITSPWWDTSEPARPLLDAAVAAKGRGVDVRVVARPDRSNDAALARLRDAGIYVVPISNIHDKFVLSDDLLAVHSTNFTRKELSDNQNSGRFTSDAPDVGTYEAMFKQLVARRDAHAVGDAKWTRASVHIPPILEGYLHQYEKLNPLQSMAVPAVLSATGHTMVVAPTSSGKTLVGEVAALRSIILEGRPAVWLVPARALAAEVAQTAERWTRLGIGSLALTGEVNLSSQKARRAQLWIATTEKFESLYRRSTLTDFIDRVGCLIIDEVHLVGDPSRGAALESLIARLRAAEARTRIVALSATAANAQELADWFHATLIQSPWRPTILTTQIVRYQPGHGNTEWQKDASGKDVAVSELLRDLATTDPEKPVSLSEAMGTEGLGSVLVFCGSKNSVRRTAAMLAGVQAGQDDDEQLVERAFARGVGIHFRDAPGASEALRAFNSRRIRTLVATSGLSTGVNTPARIVIIRDLVLGKEDLEVSQAQQMLGRAGRAGQEKEGFGFLLAPDSKESEWRRKLAEGYRVDSQLLGQIDDAVLAEILLGSITSRTDAEIWFRGTFAYAQSAELHDVGAVIDALVRHRLISEGEDALTVTELGKVTARLMVGVEAACGMLAELPSIGYPLDAVMAENHVLGLVARSVPALRDLPVNERVYEEWVSQTLSSWGDGLSDLTGEDFGSRFTAAAAAAALRRPGSLSVPRGSKMSRAELVRAVNEMPRFLNWLAALGELGQSAWAPAVASDLSRRLQWWNLEPMPTRGSGRLLGFLEQLLDSEHRARRMPDLWKRARGRRFDQPNTIWSAPRNVDVTGEGFAEVANRRATLVLAPPEKLSLSVEARPYDAQIAVLTNCGSAPVLTSTRALGQRIELPVPHGTVGGELAADLILYTRSDFAYQNLTTEIPEQSRAHSAEVLEDARQLIRQLNPSTAVVRRWSKLHWKFMSERKKKLADLMPQVAPEPGFTEIAELLGGSSRDAAAQVNALRAGLEQLLDLTGPSESIRSAGAVLVSRKATAREFECVLLALVAALGIEIGMAMSNENNLVALVEVGGQWRTATPLNDGRAHISQPLSPATLPPNIRPIVEPQPRRRVAPLIPWLIEFAPGSGESSSMPTATTQYAAGVRGAARAVEQELVTTINVTALAIDEPMPDLDPIPDPSIFESTRCGNCGANRVQSPVCETCRGLLCSSCNAPCRCVHAVSDATTEVAARCAECGRECCNDDSCSDCEAPLCDSCKCHCWLDAEQVRACKGCGDVLDEVDRIYGSGADRNELVCNGCRAEEEWDLCPYCGADEDCDCP